MYGDDHILSSVSLHFYCGGFFGGYSNVMVMEELCQVHQ